MVSQPSASLHTRRFQRLQAQSRLVLSKRLAMDRFQSGKMIRRGVPVFSLFHRSERFAQSPLNQLHSLRWTFIALHQSRSRPHVIALCAPPQRRAHPVMHPAYPACGTTVRGYAP